jgi:hypothetical protein
MLVSVAEVNKNDATILKDRGGDSREHCWLLSGPGSPSPNANE